MDTFVSLAEELMEVLDRKKRGMPHEEISASMRGEMAVLRLLAEEGRALTAGEISRLLNMTTSRIAAVLGALDRKALIVRSTDVQDKRRIQVTLTDRGLAMCQRKKQAALKNISHALSQLGEQDAAEFVRLFRRMSDVLPPPPPPCVEDEDENKA